MNAFRTRPDRVTAISCTIGIATDGIITVRRDPDCTPDDVRQLCQALASGELEVINLVREPCDT